LEESPRPRALFLAPEAPYPAAGGGALRSASLVQYLAGRYRLDLIVFREPDSPDPAGLVPQGLFEDVLVLDLARHSRTRLARLARNLDRARRGAPPLADRFSGFGPSIAAFVRDKHYRLAVIEHLWCAPYWEQIAPRSDTVALDAHNVECVLMERCAAVESWPMTFLLRRFQQAWLTLERRWLPRFGLVLAASGPDAAVLADLAPSTRVCVYPNSLALVPRPEVEEEQAIVFTGNFDYPPNRDAVQYFHGRIWPLLRSRYPDLMWRLAGKNAEAVARFVQHDRRIQILGPVTDAVVELARARVAIVPLRAGSGTRFKILEAWAAGRAVVSTSIGAEGLGAVDGEHLLLADTPERFAGAVSALLDSADLRGRLGRAGRRLYEERFTWESAWASLTEAGL
jgi:glycosyltransferase involved in cell wall biosynthesis